MTPSPESPLVSIAIVSFNSRTHLERCLRSIEATVAPPREVLVVDNASTDGTVEALAPDWPGVRWIANRRNVGFARASNQALAQAGAPFWLMLNPDAELEPGAVESLLRYLEDHPEAAVAGPVVKRPDGRLEPSAGWVPTPGRELVETLLLFRLGLRGRLLRGEPPGPVAVDWVSGCAMLVRADAAREVGLFDERYFLYVEDLDWCWRFRRAGWEVVLVPGPRVLHHRGASVLGSPDTLVNGERNLEYFVRKHGLRFPIPLLRGLELANLATRAPWLAWRGARGDRRARDEARLFARSAWRALATLAAPPPPVDTGR